MGLKCPFGSGGGIWGMLWKTIKAQKTEQKQHLATSQKRISTWVMLAIATLGLASAAVATPVFSNGNFETLSATAGNANSTMGSTVALYARRRATPPAFLTWHLGARPVRPAGAGPQVQLRRSCLQAPMEPRSITRTGCGTQFIPFKTVRMAATSWPSTAIRPSMPPYRRQ